MAPTAAGALLLCALAAACSSQGVDCPALALLGRVVVSVPFASVAGVPDEARVCVVGDCVTADVTRDGDDWRVTRTFGGSYRGDVTVSAELFAQGRSLLLASGRVPAVEQSSGSGPCRLTATGATARYDPATRTLVPA